LYLFSYLAQQQAKTPKLVEAVNVTPCQVLTPVQAAASYAQVPTPVAAPPVVATPTTTTTSSLTPTVLSTPVTSTPIIHPPPAIEESTGIKAAWNVLMDDSSWKIVKEKDEWKNRIGAHSHDSLEFIEDYEIDELGTLLAPIPFRRFKKFMNK
jgi:hypothetical protein